MNIQTNEATNLDPRSPNVEPRQQPQHFSLDDTLEHPIDMWDVADVGEHADSDAYIQDQILVFAASAMGTVMLAAGFLFFGGFGTF